MYAKALTLLHIERSEEALIKINEALDSQPDNKDMLNLKSAVLSKLDRHEEALTIVDQVLETDPDNHSFLYDKACYHSLLSQADLSIQCLQKAIALEGGTEYIDMAKTDSDFDAIRDHADFQRLLATSR